MIRPGAAVRPRALLQTMSAMHDAETATFTVIHGTDAPQVSVEAPPADDHIDVTWSASDPSSGSGQAPSIITFLKRNISAL